MMRLCNLIPTAAKLQLYKAAILPHMIYCSTVCHYCRGSDARKLERVQERGIMCGILRLEMTLSKQLLREQNYPPYLIEDCKT